LGSIPLDPIVTKGGDQGIPVVIHSPDSTVAKSLIEIAQQVAAKASVAAMRQKKAVSINLVD